MSKIKELERIIDEQRKDHRDEPEYMIGSQLLDMASGDDEIIDLLIKDLYIEEMSLKGAAAMFQKYADNNYGKHKSFCITPEMSDKLLREFYGLPKRSIQKQSVKKSSFVDLSNFL